MPTDILCGLGDHRNGCEATPASTLQQFENANDLWQKETLPTHHAVSIYINLNL